MKVDITEVVKDWHIRICIAILILASFATFGLGNSTQFIPSWFAYLYGWSGLTVAIKLSSIWYKDKQ
jgi:hypothetical protein